MRSKGASSAGLQPYVAIVYPETGDLVETNFTVFFRVKHFELPAGIHAIAACPALVGSVNCAPADGKAVAFIDGQPAWQVAEAPRLVAPDDARAVAPSCEKGVVLQISSTNSGGEVHLVFPLIRVPAGGHKVTISLVDHQARCDPRL